MLKLADITPQSDLLGDFNVRQAIGLSSARELLRGRGTPARPPAIETLRRWILVGARVRGQVVKLKARLLNNEYLTTEQWVREFEAERLRLGSLDPLADEPTSRRRAAEKRAAEKALDAAGIGTPRQGKR